MQVRNYIKENEKRFYDELFFVDSYPFCQCTVGAQGGYDTLCRTMA